MIGAPELSAEDEALIAFQTVQTEVALAEGEDLQGALEAQLERTKTEEAFNKKIWDYYHSIIFNYEKAIQYNAGPFIGAPFSESDVVNLANNAGRLYQGTVSTMAKVIPEMVGGGLAGGLSPHELDNKAEIDLLVGFILSGTSAASTIYGSFAAGTIDLLTNIGANRWGTANRVSMMLLGTPTTIPAVVGPPATPVRYRYPIIRSINGTAAGGSLIAWTGYTNAERTSPRVTNPGTSTQQSLMNELVRLLGLEITRWMGFLGNVIDAEKHNQSPNLTPAMRQVSTDLYAYLTQYLAGPAGAEQLWLQNGAGGIDGFKTEYLNRYTTTGPALVARSKSDKELFYPARIGYTNIRADIQRGSLTTVNYLTALIAKYPDPFLTQKRDILKLWKKP